MNLESRNSHHQNEWEFLLNIFLDHINLHGLDLRGRAKVQKFCDRVSSKIKEKRLGGSPFVEDTPDTPVPEHITHAGKKLLHSVHVGELTPFTYNLFYEEGIDELVADLQAGLEKRIEEENVVALKEMISDYRIFYHLDLYDEQAVKHFGKWFAEATDEYRMFDD